MRAAKKFALIPRTETHIDNSRSSVNKKAFPRTQEQGFMVTAFLSRYASKQSERRALDKICICFGCMHARAALTDFPSANNTMHTAAAARQVPISEVCASAARKINNKAHTAQ
jgi:hypothetical protein